ncbi:right-handed parallel beta-helix repeat-containing protein [Microbulbifer sp. ZKSA002]|uniref:right-handed parallel beta-helix repeat-containing protein n=1 Tax=Microbulbifer sp. ZKSA002 TaxID=3243388 RepID=UPI0040396D8C
MSFSPKTLLAPGVVMSTLYFSSVCIADVECGDTITDAQTLTGELSCSEDPAITVEGPDGSLVMSGEGAIECTTDGVGVLMLGTSGVVTGGVVSNCETGLELAGSGLHKVFSVTVEESSGAGVFAESDSNLIRQNTLSNITNVQASGIVLEGVANVAIGNSVSGFFENGIGGFGFFSYIGNNYLEGNAVAISLGARIIDGVTVGASFCVIASNNVQNNEIWGIAIGGPYVIQNMDNVVSGNTVAGSGFDDLLDDNEASDCSSGTNIWSGNTANTSFPSCLKDL